MENKNEIMEKVRTRLVTTSSEHVELIEYVKRFSGYTHVEVLYTGGNVFVSDLKSLNVLRVEPVGDHKLRLKILLKDKEA